jgi:hypothetical protein
MKRSDLSKVLKGVYEHRLLLIEKWSKFHG